MGGMSFKCTKCNQWFIHKEALKMHLMNKHEVFGRYTIEGTGPRTYIREQPFTPPKFKDKPE